MSHSTEPTNPGTEGYHVEGPSGAAHCPLDSEPCGVTSLSADQCRGVAEYGPPPGPVEDHLRFEALLANLSASFVSVPAGEIDSRIEWGLRQIVEYLGVDRSGLGEVSADRTRFEITHSYQLPGVPPAPRVILETEFPYYARMIYRGAVFRVPEDLPPEAAREREYCRRVGLKSNLTIPLKVEGAVVGGIGFASFRGERDWPEQQVRRLRLLGEVFTNALARKRADEALRDRERSLRVAQEGLRELAGKLLHSQEEERRRVAREMHDDWAQRLAVLSIKVVNLEQLVSASPAALPLLRGMQDELVRLSEDVHDLSRQLHPSILDDLGLVEALRSECASFSRREGAPVQFRTEGVPTSLPGDVALCIYRVAQEALRNVAKHSSSPSARVSLTGTRSALVLLVQDEGVGFDPSGHRGRGGLGLASMHERARLIGAGLRILSAPGRGTTIELRVPLTTEQP